MTNECVIVPDFGGFMTHQVSARYDEADRSFLPPYRTLGFNPQLRINDSVLAQSYVEANDISYPEALRRIESEVAVLKQELSDKGSYEMENLGVLTVNQEGNYEFTPCEAGVLSPSLYGLSDFTFKRLKDSSSVETARKSLPTVASEVSIQPSMLDVLDDHQDNQEEKAVVIKMSWIRNAVAVAAAVVAFFLIATPIANGDFDTQTMSQLQHNLLYKLIPQDTNVVPVEPAIAPSAPVASAPVAPTATQKEKTTAPESPKAPEAKKTTPTYYIVVASQVKMSNAEAYVEQLHKEGYQDAQVMVRNNIVRVVCGSFDSENDAYRQLNKMNVKEEFYEAWVYKDVSKV